MTSSISTARVSRLAVATLLICLGTASAATYYVSPNGNDNNSGLDPSSPWRSAFKVNSSTFAPGSQILFQRGGEWRESLLVPSSGTEDQPIIFDAYGSGPKPRFWGSDVLNKSLFQPVAGSSSTYSMPVSGSNNVLLDHEFAHSAALLTKSADVTTNVNYVKSNPNSWYFGGGQLYLNTGGPSPASDPRLYTSVTRDNVIHANQQNHIIFRNLVTDESAIFNAGCGFRVFAGDNVHIESSEAYRAGKHHFCVTNANGFIGKNLYAAYAMPDQGYGGASAYVSYSDPNRHNDTSSWIDVVADHPNGEYPGFITHGSGMGDILLRNMVVRGGPGMSIYTEGPSQRINIEGGSVEGMVSIGSNVTIDGLKISGPTAAIDITGNNNLVQNTLLLGRQVNWQAGQRGAITDNGQNNTLRFNTIILDPATSAGGGAIGINRSYSNTKIYGNVFADPHAIVLYALNAPISSHDNFFANDALFGLFQSTTMVYQTLAQWRAMGYDLDSLMAAVNFENPQRGNYALVANSPGADQFIDPVLFPATDLRGFPRPLFSGADMGAFERPKPGDANFDGVIDELDYALIDRAMRNRDLNAGFANGDFNFSGGQPNSDDYFIIDHAFIQQWLAQNGAFFNEGGTVPEPATLSLMAIAAAFSLRCRRHDRRPYRQR